MDAIQVGVACPCPGTPHPDGDTVGLRPKLGLRSGVAVQAHIIGLARSQGGSAAADLEGRLTEVYLLEGVSEWSFVDELGKPIPVNADTIRTHLLDDFSLAYPVAEKADEVYMQAVVAPLVKKAGSLLPDSQTNGSTSALQKPTSIRPKRSKRSSTGTSPTDGTETTTSSPDGDSK